MMNQCQDIRSRMTLYFDDELQGPERVDFECHLSVCEACRLRAESERRFLETIRQARRMYKASSELRSRIENLIAPAPLSVPPTTPALNNQVAAAASRRMLAGLATVLLFLAILGLWSARREGRKLPAGPSEFALMAADAHLRHIRGQLPLEVTSAAPEQISSWFHDKLSFSVKLPNYQEASGQRKLYDLEGARLVGFKKDYAAYVAYQMDQRPISLVITSNQVAQPSGGEQIAAKGLTFHYDSLNGFKVLTWSDRGLTYALVSDFEERGQQSCVVCHHGSKDQDFIEPLRPHS